MRGLAILLVVFYHNFGFINYFFFGWLGVDLFFVLSGFLITDILLSTHQDKHFLRNFYLRRVLRIFPLYYLTLIIFLLILANISNLNPALEYYLNNQIWLWTYLQNWLFIFKPTENTNVLHHFWSLAVEEQFYLFWPPFVFFIPNPKRLLMLISSLLVAILFARSIIWVYRIEELAYFNLYTFTRIDGICIGCMLALIHKIDSKFLNIHRPLIVLLFAGFNFIFYFINMQYEFTFPYLALIGYTTFALLFSLLVYEGIKPKANLVQTIFSFKPLIFLGKISFGLYIFHWPVYILLRPHLNNWMLINFNSQSNIITSLTLSLFAVLVSFLSFRFFELKFLNLKKRFE